MDTYLIFYETTDLDMIRKEVDPNMIHVQLNSLILYIPFVVD